MKKICILLALILCCGAVQAQSNCKVQGVVRYFYNDFVGYRADLGAEIRFIPVTPQDTIPNCDKWSDYYWKSHTVISYLIKVEEWKDEGIYYGDNKKTLQSLYGVDDEYMEKFSQLSSDLIPEVTPLLERDEYMCLVDNSGMYQIELPQGEYYVVMKSANRKRPLGFVDYSGRMYVKKIKLDSSTKVISHDFEL